MALREQPGLSVIGLAHEVNSGVQEAGIYHQLVSENHGGDGFGEQAALCTNTMIKDLWKPYVLIQKQAVNGSQVFQPIKK